MFNKALSYVTPLDRKSQRSKFLHFLGQIHSQKFKNQKLPKTKIYDFVEPVREYQRTYGQINAKFTSYCIDLARFALSVNSSPVRQLLKLSTIFSPSRKISIT